MSELSTHRAIDESDSQLSPPRKSEVEIGSSRAAQEVQAMMIVAKRFPRSEQEARERIRNACRRPKLAEAAAYEYPRGGTPVTGPSIRLAEVLAQAWGNLYCDLVEVERRDEESTMQAVCWDLETNTQVRKTFTIPHLRDKRGGPVKLTDSRDIYELIANQGARRLRACILAMIPGDIVDEAIAECNKTLDGQNADPLADRIGACLRAFDSDFGVSRKEIEAMFQCRADDLTERGLGRLRNIYRSLKDGMSKPEDHFARQPERPAEEPGAKLKTPSPPAPDAPTVPTNYIEIPMKILDKPEPASDRMAARVGASGK